MPALKANFSLVHEIGHLIGASHELGYVHGNEWRDIMSYKANCGGCPRLPVWSNPEVLIGVAPCWFCRARQRPRDRRERAARRGFSLKLNGARGPAVNMNGSSVSWPLF